MTPPPGTLLLMESGSSVVGWREWVALPDWGVGAIKAKIDTGARTSALHVFDLESFDRDGVHWVRFGVHPWQRSDDDAVLVETELADQRTVTSSSGTRSHRPVVVTSIEIAGHRIPTEITLTRRDNLGFRMLVGRQALEQGFMVAPSASYVGGRPHKSVRRRNRGHG